MNISESLAKIRTAIKDERNDDAWEEMRRLEPWLESEHEVAWTWVRLAEMFPHDDAREEVRRIAAAWSHDAEMVRLAAEALIAPCDGRAADDQIADDDPAFEAVELLDGVLANLSPEQARHAATIWHTLGQATRLAGPRYDARCEQAYRTTLSFGDSSACRFNLGLFFKQRGRWEEGVKIYQQLADEDATESVLWNLAICATAARKSVIAIEAWKKLGFEATMGTDGLPFVPKLGSVKVRLTSSDFRNPYGPRDHEHVWVEPRSPCHGVVQNPTMYEVNVDVSDVVLWDGAPIGWVDPEQRVPRFAMLEKLEAGPTRTFRFRARGDMKSLNKALFAMGEELVLYPFNENVLNICRKCLENPSRAHDRSHTRETAKAVVSEGKFVIENGLAPTIAFDRLTKVLKKTPGAVIAIPAVLEEIGSGDAKHHRELWSRLEEID